jgi:hypothetical protein
MTNAVLEIFDDFLNDDELAVVERTFRGLHYTYGHRSGFERIAPEFFCHYITDEFFTVHLKKKIEQHVNLKLELLRTYMFVQTFGLEGCFHVDCVDKTAFTFCLYLTPEARSDDFLEGRGGEFLLRLPNKPYLVAVEPKYNRGVGFPGHLRHKGDSFNKSTDVGRVCVTWKFLVEGF